MKMNFKDEEEEEEEEINNYYNIKEELTAFYYDLLQVAVVNH